MSYIDGFVLAVPTAGKQAYIDYARRMDTLFLEYGALRIVEGWGDDVPGGETTSFPMAVKAGADETVVFSWTEWPDKETRDTAWGKMMADPRFDPATNPMPCDGKRMIYGGFEPIVMLGG